MVKYGRVGKERNPFVWWVLGMCFVVDFVWFYRAWKEIAEFTRKEINPVLKTIFMAIPVLNLITAYQMFREISGMEYMVGIPEEKRLNPVVTLLLCIVFGIGLIFAQKHLNDIWGAA